MIPLLQRFLLYLAGATDSQLRDMVEYLKAENQFLRSRLPDRLTVTEREKRTLLQLGQKLGTALKELITIVSYHTFCRWLGQVATKRTVVRKRGRPPTPEQIREVILRMASETGWGYTRILGELKKLGIGGVSRSTVVNILKQNGFDIGPKRGQGSWSDFIARHAHTLWACDFFSKPVWTLKGSVEVFALFFIHIGTRRVHFAGLTPNPNEAWVLQQARNFVLRVEEGTEKGKYLIMDLDTKFTLKFRERLESAGIELVRVGPKKPNLNAFAERWVQTVRRECLDRFVVFGESHLQHLIHEFLKHYNEERTYQGLGNRTLDSPEEPVILPFPKKAKVVCQERLGGPLKSYARKAA